MWSPAFLTVLATVVAALALVVFVRDRRLSARSTSAERRYEQLVQAATDMIIQFDREGKFVAVNAATVEQSGYTFAELKANPNSTFFPAEDYASMLDALREIQQGTERAMTVRYRRKDGHERWVSCRATPLSVSGAKGGILVIARDVTDDMVRTQSLRQSEERFRSLVSAFDRAFFVQDLDGRFAGLFGRWLKSAGIDATTYLGRTVRELIPEEAGPHEEAFARVLQGEDVSYVARFPAPDGELRSLRVSMSPMRDSEGRINGVAGVAADITRRARAEAEATELRQRVAASERIESLGKLVSGVAHELNNPLAAILNFTEDLLLDTRAPDERSALEIIQAQALRSRTIVRDLLTFVRRGSDRPRVVQSPGPIIESLLTAIRPGLPIGVRVRETVGDVDTPLDVDRAGVEQVLTNLIANAAQASPGGHVWVTSRRDGAWYEIAVEDDGPGIKPEHLPRLFEPFFTTKPTGQGVGLGLSVSLGIVQLHNGTLTAGPRAPEAGSGARFTLRLPVSDRPIEAVIATLTPPRRRQSLTPVTGVPTLLVIDDEAPIRRALRRYFERRGWVVDEAEDGGDALAMLSDPEATRRFDVVLCDLKMPGMSGPDLYERLRLEAPGVLERIIFVTGDVTGTQAAEFLAQVKGPVLEKPFELATIGALADDLRSHVAVKRG